MNNNHPMRYLAKMQMFPASPTMENAFAVSGTSARDFMLNEYNLNKNDWDNKMNKAYVSND